MLNSKFDINSPEWIDRVFENRNKSYGAYDLRKRYAANLFKAFTITILSIAAIAAVAAYVLDEKTASVNINKGTIVKNNPVEIIPDGTNKADGTPSKTTPKNTAPAKGTPSDPIDAKELDIKPSPFGGAAAWANFLETNLRYPEDALDKRIMGSVLMSFVVERDGAISNIAIERPAGHGFDEEALRVLKLSPPWSSGTQHGQRVRTKYVLPINFRIQKK